MGYPEQTNGGSAPPYERTTGIDPRWWEAERFRPIAGVFEGGGAKGVAFTGALRSVHGHGLWFSSVAGASAGAITAALVAAGVHPEQLGELTSKALAQIKWSKRRSILYVRLLTNLFLKTGALRKDRLTRWLDGLLIRQVGRFSGGSAPDGPVTFRTLYDATGIELNVVAADISTHRQIVFNHRETPDCEVSAAVVASSSIPFAFPSSDLAVESPKHGKRYHTIVDGGVWTNFPMFVYEDVAYRRSRNLPDRPDVDHVIGFLLDEDGEAAELRDRTRNEEVRKPYQTATFVGAEQQEFQAWEWRNDARLSRVRRFLRLFELPALPLALERYVLAVGGVWRVLGGGFGGTGKRLWARWPTPGSTFLRVLLRFADGTLGVLSYLVLGLLAWFLLAYVSFEASLELWGALPEAGWQALIVAPTIFALWCLILLLLLGSLWIVLTYPTVRRIGFGLATTYVAGGGAQPWVGASDNVIPLPIPGSVSTLSFGMPAPDLTSLASEAQAETDRYLDALLKAEDEAQSESLAPAEPVASPRG